MIDPAGTPIIWVKGTSKKILVVNNFVSQYDLDLIVSYVTVTEPSTKGTNVNSNNLDGLHRITNLWFFQCPDDIEYLNSPTNTLNNVPHNHYEVDILDLVHDAKAIWGRPISDVIPSNGDTYVWNAETEQWEPGDATPNTPEPENLSALCDGVATVFTLSAPYTPGKLAVFLNGLLQTLDVDYTETGSDTFSFIAAPVAGDALVVYYSPIGGGGSSSGNATLIQGRSVSDAAPEANDALAWNALTERWEPQAISTAPLDHTHVEADITDLSYNAKAFQGRDVADTPPSEGDAYVWNSVTSLWEPKAAASSSTLAGLLDVGISTTPDNDQVLMFKTGAGQWRAATLPAPPTTERTREFDFQPEFAGAVIDPTTLGIGLLEAYTDVNYNAYEWTVNEVTEQSAYIYLRWRLPPGFVSFSSGLKVLSKVSDTGKNCGVEVLGFYDGSGVNAVAYATFANADWAENTLNLVAGTFVAGAIVLVKLRLFGQNTSITYLSGVRIQYVGD